MWRVILKAEVMAAGDNPRFVVTSLADPPPQMLYEDLYCARGNCENAIKAVNCDLHSDRTSATTFLANSLRLLLSCAAYVLHHALRTHTLQHTALAHAQPSTLILTLFNVSSLPIMEKGEQFLKVIEIFALLCSHYKMSL